MLETTPEPIGAQLINKLDFGYDLNDDEVDYLIELVEKDMLSNV